MKRNKNLLVFILVFFIKEIWQNRLSKKYNKKYKVICRFYPTCSDYSVLALKKYGFLKGVHLTYKRIKRCNNENTGECFDFP